MFSKIKGKHVLKGLRRKMLKNIMRTKDRKIYFATKFPFLVQM